MMHMMHPLCDSVNGNATSGADSVDYAPHLRGTPVTRNRPEELTEYSVTALLTPPERPEEPADFDEFWRGTFEAYGNGLVSWESVR